MNQLPPNLLLNQRIYHVTHQMFMDQTWSEADITAMINDSNNWAAYDPGHAGSTFMRGRVGLTSNQQMSWTDWEVAHILCNPVLKQSTIFVWPHINGAGVVQHYNIIPPGDLSHAARWNIQTPGGYGYTMNPLGVNVVANMFHFRQKMKRNKLNSLQPDSESDHPTMFEVVGQHEAMDQQWSASELEGMAEVLGGPAQKAPARPTVTTVRAPPAKATPVSKATITPSSTRSNASKSSVVASSIARLPSSNRSPTVYDVVSSSRRNSPKKSSPMPAGGIPAATVLRSKLTPVDANTMAAIFKAEDEADAAAGIEDSSSNSNSKSTATSIPVSILTRSISPAVKTPATSAHARLTTSAPTRAPAIRPAAKKLFF